MVTRRLLAEGRIVADGPLGAVLTAENLARVFGITVHMAQGTDDLLFPPLDLIGP